MTTAREAYRLGLRFERDRHASLVAADGPPEVMAIARAEVARRVDAMANPPRLRVDTGFCDACGDPMQEWFGGWCEWCTLARRVALRKAPRKAFVEIKTLNIANASEHHFARAQRVLAEKHATLIALQRDIGCPVPLPVRVSLTRSSPRDVIDSDGAIIAMKSVRDMIAQWLGCADDHDAPDLVWDYSAPKVVGPMGVHVTITPVR